MRWPFVRRSTLERERDERADAVNGAIYWRRCHNDHLCVSHARAVAIEALCRHWNTGASIDQIAKDLDRAAKDMEDGGKDPDGVPGEVRSLAALEIRMRM